MKTTTLIAISTFILFFGCKKETTDPPKPKTKTEMLVQKTWQVDELYVDINGTISSYVRGGANSTGINFGLDRFTFKADGTGTYISEAGQSFESAWLFTDSNERTIQFTIKTTPNPTIFVWRLVEITENAVHQTSVVSGINELITIRLMPVP